MSGAPGQPRPSGGSGPRPGGGSGTGPKAFTTTKTPASRPEPAPASSTSAGAGRHFHPLSRAGGAAPVAGPATHGTTPAVDGERAVFRGSAP